MNNYVITSAGEIIDLPNPRNGTHYCLEELQRFIGGGFIELVHIDESNFMVVDEEGLLKGLPNNKRATQMYQEMAFLSGSISQDIIAGDAAIIAKEQIQ